MFNTNVRVITLFCLAAGLIYFFQIRAKDSDRAEYAALIAETKAMKAEHRNNQLQTWQKRTGVQKDIWKNENHYLLRSAHSDLTVRQKKKSFEMVEHLHDLECFTYQGNELRVLKSKEGTYFFPAHRFTADEVDLFYYRDSEPILQGHATHVEGAAEQDIFEFTASRFKAEVTK